MTDAPGNGTGTDVGLSYHPTKFLLYAARKGADFSQTLALGRQRISLVPRDLRALLKAFHKTPVSDSDKPAAHFGGHWDVLDISPYEGATILHDLNLPVPPELHERFTCVFDGGTTQHLFDLPQAFLNIMRMLKPGGMFVSATVANNYLGHGLYQFSPELIHATFAPRNGFEMVDLVLTRATRRERWYRVPRITRSGGRVEICNAEPLKLLYAARKIAAAVPGRLDVYNSDYERQWEKSRKGLSVARNADHRAHRLREALPAPLSNAIQTFRYTYRQFVWHRDLAAVPDAEIFGEGGGG